MTRTATSASPRPTSLHTGVLTTLVFLVLAFCTAQAGEASRPATTADQPSVEVMPTTAAMRVAIDPVTGQITVPGKDAIGFQPLWSMGQLPSAPLPVVRLADGSLMVDLRGIFLTNAVASIGWDGHPTVGCAEFGVDPVEYARWLTLTAAPQRAKVSE
jgi:hypothetical protein